MLVATGVLLDIQIAETRIRVCVCTDPVVHYICEYFCVQFLLMESLRL